MTVQHKFTDDAAAVEFDFRCKIDDQFVIIDMQQWFKSDVVQWNTTKPLTISKQNRIYAKGNG